MESHGIPGAVHLSARTFALIKNRNHFKIEPRGDIEVKGLGVMSTYICTGCVGAPPRPETAVADKIAALGLVNVDRRGSVPRSSVTEDSNVRTAHTRAHRRGRMAC